MTKTIEDEERAFYLRNGISEYTAQATPLLKMLEDMRREYYLNNITLPATPTAKEKEKTTDDLELIWLKEQSGITNTNSPADLWFRWLKPTYGALTVEDLKMKYYINN